MKNVIKTICSAIFIIGIIFVFQKGKNYLTDNVISIYNGNTKKNQESNWSVYLTKDCKLVLCNVNNSHLNEYKFGTVEFSKHTDDYYELIDNSLCDALKEQLIQLYIDLLTYINTDNFKSVDTPKRLAFHIFRKDLLIRKCLFNILSKTYIDFKKDVYLKNDVRLATVDDIKIIKKDNTYSIILGDRILNIMFELEVLLDNLERQNINTKPHRNYLKMLISNK